MTTNLMKASNQWATRPADQRFASIEALHAHCATMHSEAKEFGTPWSTLRVEADGAELRLVGKTGVPAKLTNYSFNQLTQRIGAPAGYLSQLPATLAAQNINHGFAHYGEKVGDDRPANLLMRVNGVMELRAALTDHYERIWNEDITSRLIPLQSRGWRVPPARPAFEDQPGTRPATEDDVLRSKAIPGLSINVGDPIAPAGLYASDRDMFAFLVNEEAQIDDGSGNPMSRGFFVWNSEVGDKSFGIETFLYQTVCGNHIVWGAEDVQTVRIAHIGKNTGTKAWWQIERSVDVYLNSSAAQTEADIKSARRQIIAATKDELLDKLFAMKGFGLSRKAIEGSYEEAVLSIDTHKADPASKWGMVEGITRYSQKTPYADARSALDRAAGKLMRAEF